MPLLWGSGWMVQWDGGAGNGNMGDAEREELPVLGVA